MASLKWTFIVTAVAYLGVTALMYVMQRAIMYFPETVRTPPAVAGVTLAQEVVLDTPDGEKIIVWYAAPRDGKPVVLYFHGNGGSLRYRAERFKRLTAAGFGLVALSYRGYAGSTGKPTEGGLIEDARTAYAFATSRHPDARIALWGESLGSGVAVALAAEKKVARVVLDAPFTSTSDVAARTYFFLPVRLLMKDQFRSDERIARVTAPVLILHGDADTIVPFAFGERLYAMIPGEKRMVRYPGGHHVDLDRYGASDEAMRFFLE